VIRTDLSFYSFAASQKNYQFKKRATIEGLAFKSYDFVVRVGTMSVGYPKLLLVQFEYTPIISGMGEKIIEEAATFLLQVNKEKLG